MWQSHGGILFSFYSMGWVDDDDRTIIHNNNDDEAILIVLRARETFRRVERLSTDWQPLATMARLLYQFSLSLSPCPRFLYHTHTLSLSLSSSPLFSIMLSLFLIQPVDGFRTVQCGGGVVCFVSCSRRRHQSTFKSIKSRRQLHQLSA